MALDGTIDFLCWPNLDSPSIFAALLDPDEGGEFSLAPTLRGTRTIQLYLPDTNVLMTRWLSLEGSAEITDLMPHPDVAGSVHHCLIRRVRATHGTVGFRLRCRPRFDYGRLVPAAAAEGDAVVFSGGDFLPLRLSGCVSVKMGEGDASPSRTCRRAISTGVSGLPRPDFRHVLRRVSISQGIDTVLNVPARYDTGGTGSG